MSVRPRARAPPTTRSSTAQQRLRQLVSLVALNRAVAVAEDEGAEAALAVVDGRRCRDTTCSTRYGKVSSYLVEERVDAVQGSNRSQVPSARPLLPGNLGEIRRRWAA
jgi:hypothetical protein